jgi:23S rRNA (adenine2030-N6)-methyltransferase
MRHCRGADGCTDRKDKPLSYIETHGGRGLYDLGAIKPSKPAKLRLVLLLQRLGLTQITWLTTLAACRAENSATSYPAAL